LKIRVIDVIYVHRILKMTE